LFVVRSVTAQPGDAGREAVALNSGRAATLSHDASTLSLGRSAPYADLLAARQGVLEAGNSDATSGADALCLRAIVVIVGIEDCRVETLALTELTPINGSHEIPHDL
jgi:hypothetical protein